MQQQSTFRERGRGRGTNLNQMKNRVSEFARSFTIVNFIAAINLTPYPSLLLSSLPKVGGFGLWELRSQGRQWAVCSLTQQLAQEERAGMLWMDVVNKNYSWRGIEIEAWWDRSRDSSCGNVEVMVAVAAHVVGGCLTNGRIVAAGRRWCCKCRTY